MGKFGWSLPPGCGTLPGEEEYPCEVCGKFPEDCICPECPVCSTQGDPKCYIEHGLVLSAEQIKSHQAFVDKEFEFLRREAEWLKDMQKTSLADSILNGEEG